MIDRGDLRCLLRRGTGGRLPAASVADYQGHFLLPTLAGNAVGGTILAAPLNHAPIVTELRAGTVVD